MFERMFRFLLVRSHANNINFICAYGCFRDLDSSPNCCFFVPQNTGKVTSHSLQNRIYFLFVCYVHTRLTSRSKIQRLKLPRYIPMDNYDEYAGSNRTPIS